MCTYQSFITPAALFEKLQDRFRPPAKLVADGLPFEEIQIAVLGVFGLWFHRYYRDFDTGMLKQLKELVKEARTNKALSIQLRLLEKSIEGKV